MLSFKPTFSLSSFTFICISEVIDISPGNLDSSFGHSGPVFVTSLLVVVLPLVTIVFFFVEVKRLYVGDYYKLSSR